MPLDDTQMYAEFDSVQREEGIYENHRKASKTEPLLTCSVTYVVAHRSTGA